MLRQGTRRNLQAFHGFFGFMVAESLAALAPISNIELHGPAPEVGPSVERSDGYPRAFFWRDEALLVSAGSVARGEGFVPKAGLAWDLRPAALLNAGLPPL